MSNIILLHDSPDSDYAATIIIAYWCRAENIFMIQCSVQLLNFPNSMLTYNPLQYDILIRFETSHI